MDDGINEHEYLMTEGYLWTGQYPECKRILEKGNNQSMELDEKTVQGQRTKTSNGKEELFIINEAIISKLCILGENVEPCFEGASIGTPTIQFSFENSFKEQLFSRMEELKEYLTGKGGEEPMPNDEILEEVIEVVEDTDITTTFEEEEASPESSVPQSEEETFEKIEDENDSESFSNLEEETEEKCPECGKPIDECGCEEKTEYSLEEIPEYTELLSKYEALETSFNELKAEKERLESEIAPLAEFKKNADKKEKEAMIDSFYMLSDEDKEEYRNNIDNYSLEEIESKLSVICVRNKVSFNLDNGENFGPTTYNLEDSGEDVSTPAWVKAARAMAKTME